MLFKKLLRTALKYKAQFISMIIMVALGVGIFVGFNMEWMSIEYNTEKFFEETHLSDYKIMDEKGYSEDDYSEIAAIDGVEGASRALTVNMSVDDGGNEQLKGDALSVTVLKNYGSVSTFKLMEGEDYPTDDSSDYEGIWLSSKYAENNSVGIGDVIKLTYKSVSIESTVKGLIMSGEYLICVNESSQLMPDYTTYGYCYITPQLVKKALGTEYYTQINIVSDLSKTDMENAVNAAFGKTTLLLTRDENLSYSGAESEADEGKTMGNILPVLFLLIGVLTMITTMHRITVNEKTQIGTLKALGFRDKRILWHYTSYGLFIGIVGTLLGIALGYGIAAMIMGEGGMMSTYLDLPYHSLVMYWYYWFVLVALIAFLTLISFLSVKQMLKGTAADALRPYTPKKMKKLAIEKTKLWGKLPFGTKWNTRDLFRHKARSLMTLIGVLGCMVLIVGGMGMKDTMDVFLDDLDKTNNYTTKITLAEDISYEKADMLNTLYGGDWVASTSVKLNDDPVSLEIYEISNDMIRFTDEKDNIIGLNDDGAYICRRIADTGISVGDTITVSPYGSSGSYSIKVVGIIRSVSESIVMTKNYADSVSIPYTITSIFTDMEAKDIAPNDSITNTQSQQTIMDSYDSFMEIMNMMIVLLIVAAVILGIVVLYNLGVMSYVERYREMATLKVVGFRDRHIGRLLIGQNIFITVIGIILGLPAGFGVLYLLIKMLASEYELKVTVGALTYIVSVVLTFGVSLLVGLMVARKNKKIDMVEALKGAE